MKQLDARRKRLPAFSGSAAWRRRNVDLRAFGFALGSAFKDVHHANVRSVHSTGSAAS